MSEPAPKNHGEGNPEAAENFNSAEQKFVKSARGKQKIEEGAHVGPGEEAELEQAEQDAREHAKNDDSATAMSPKRRGAGQST